MECRVAVAGGRARGGVAEGRGLLGPGSAALPEKASPKE